MFSSFIESIINLTWEISTGMVSVVLFGEYPYPHKADYEEK